MPQDATIVLIVFAIMMFALIGFAFFIIKTINKDKKNRLRKDLLIELRDKDPDIDQDSLFDLIDRTIL